MKVSPSSDRGGVAGADLGQAEPIVAVTAQAGCGAVALGIDRAVQTAEVLELIVTAADAHEVLIVFACGGIEAEELVVAVGDAVLAEVEVQRCAPVARDGDLDNVLGVVRLIAGVLAVAGLEGGTGGSVSIGADKDFSHNVNDIELADYPDTITDDPCLKNPDGGNFQLLHSSPCIDKGENADWMEGATDLRGRARILNKVVDIGCCEASPDGLILILR